jgi:hypothetical protein
VLLGSSDEEVSSDCEVGKVAQLRIRDWALGVWCRAGRLLLCWLLVALTVGLCGGWPRRVSTDGLGLAIVAVAGCSGWACCVPCVPFCLLDTDLDAGYPGSVFWDGVGIVMGGGPG